MELELECVLCKDSVLLNVDRDGFYQWRDGGVHIQNALPNNTPEEREMMISRTCDACWQAIIPEEDEEVEYELWQWRPDGDHDWDPR